jgi:hypothetical protein
MDGPTLVTEIVKAVAWPLSTLLIVVLLRKGVVGLVDGLRLSRLKYGEWMAEFEQAKQQAAQGLPKAQPPPSLPPQEIDELIATSPTGLVVTAWNDLERTVSGIAVEAGIGKAPFPILVKELLSKRIITPETVSALDGLRQMRNLVVHAPGGEATLPRAREFATMADAMRWTVQDEATRSKQLRKSELPPSLPALQTQKPAVHETK